MDTRPTECRWCPHVADDWAALQRHINAVHPLAGSHKPGDPALGVDYDR